MAEFEKMLQGQLRRAAMIEQNIGYAFQRTVTRDCNGGQRHRFAEQGVHGNQPFDSSLQKNMRITVQQFFIVVMRDREKEKAVLPKVAFDAADDHSGISVAQIASDDADGVSALHAQTSAPNNLDDNSVRAPRREHASWCVPARSELRRNYSILLKQYRA